MCVLWKRLGPPPHLPDALLVWRRSATRSETSQIDSAMVRDVPGHPHAPSGDDRSACRHSRALHKKDPVTQKRSVLVLQMSQLGYMIKSSGPFE